MVASLFTNAHKELVLALIEMRKRAGLSQRQLAEAVKRERNYIARIETSQRRVDLIEFVILCKACNADPVVETTNVVRTIAWVVPPRQGNGRS